MRKRKENSDQNAVAELTREGLYKENKWLWEENRKLKDDNRFLTKISKEYMKKENIIEITEFTELYKNDLEEENRKLKEEIEQLKNKRVFSSEEYDLITLTSTTPQWELRKK